MSASPPNAAAAAGGTMRPPQQQGPPRAAVPNQQNGTPRAANPQARPAPGPNQQPRPAGAPGTPQARPPSSGQPQQPRPAGAAPPQQQQQQQQQPRPQNPQQPRPQQPQPQQQQGRPQPGGGPSGRPLPGSSDQTVRRSAAPSPPMSTPTPPVEKERVIEMEDDIPLVAEVYENQKWIPIVGWSTNLLTRPEWSNEEGTDAKEKDDFKVPPGWTWQGEWAVDIDDGPSGTTDSDGWSYAHDWSRRFRGTGDTSVKGVRRRRHFRRRVPPAKAVKVALGLAGGPKQNALTVGYLKNPLAVASNTVRSANSHSNANTVSGARARPAGNLSLAELYAKQTVDPVPATSDGSSSTASTASAAASPSNANGVAVGEGSLVGEAGLASGATSDSSNASSTVASNSSTLVPNGASTIGLGGERKYVPFSGLSFSGVTGLESLHSSFQSQKLAKSMVKIWEYQRYYPIMGWKPQMLPTDNKGRGPWIDENDGSKCPPKEVYQPSKDWRWTMPDWVLTVDSHTDSEGWSYAIEPSMTYHAKKSMEHFVRRRMWQREKIQRGLVTTGPRKSYIVFFERLEAFKRDLQAEADDDDLVSMASATW